MAQFEGTKGKWKIGTHFSNIVTDEKTERARYSEENFESELSYYGGYLICESVCKEADAKLIAAAPELLQALQSIAEYWDNPQKGSLNDHIENSLKMAELAIKKATE